MRALDAGASSIGSAELVCGLSRSHRLKHFMVLTGLQSYDSRFLFCPCELPPIDKSKDCERFSS